jgi:hypothetical protein
VSRDGGHPLREERGRHVRVVTFSGDAESLVLQEFYVSISSIQWTGLPGVRGWKERIGRRRLSSDD